MNLDASDIESLPLIAAMLDSSGNVLASTPEWGGASPGAASYPTGRNRLVVSLVDGAEPIQVVIDRLLAAFDNAVLASAAETQKRLRVLATSLRLVMGRTVETKGTSHEVANLTIAAATARADVELTIEHFEDEPVVAPEALALILVQLITNAAHHDQVSAMKLGFTDAAFHIRWEGTTSAKRRDAARRREDRDRWGLGFARIAADAVGAVPYLPYQMTDTVVSAVLQTGVRRLALPLALHRHGKHQKVSVGWTEETGECQGESLRERRAIAAFEAAQQADGAIMECEGRMARCTPRGTWLAIPPDEMRARCEDVFHGLQHERVLWSEAPPRQSKEIFALASVAHHLFTSRWDYQPLSAWRTTFAQGCDAFGIPCPDLNYDGIRAVDGSIWAYVLATHGSAIRAVGDDLVLELRPESAGDPMLALLGAQDGELRLQ